MIEHTDNERRGKELLGMPVYTVAEGKRLGEVTTLLVQREDSSVAAVRIGNALSQGVPVPFGQLRLVGIDAILVENEAVLNQALSPEVVRALDNVVPGRAVITASGERIGTVSGFWVQTDTGRIVAYRVRPEAGLLARLARLLRNDTLEVPIEQVQALGADALIVSDALTARADTPPEQEQ
jgi:sporulation protein YlmC with PRC-barrel domain